MRKSLWRKSILTVLSPRLFDWRFFYNIVEKSAKKNFTPSWDKSPKDTLSPKHIKYIPRQLVTREKCSLMNLNGECVKRDLEHVLLFHSISSVLQTRWSSLAASGILTYIGFHMTSAQIALQIAHSDFRVTQTWHTMLGYGIYFARTLPQISNGNYASIICAEIRMGRVLEITRELIGTVRGSNSWWENYDTVYFRHEKEERDEFCVKDPAQILRWIIATDD